MLTLKRSTESLDAPVRKAKAEAQTLVVQITNEVRQVFIPPIVGQEMTYEEKERQAIAFLAADPEPTPDMKGFKFIFGEVGVTASTPRGVAERVIYQGEMYRETVGPMIERLRLVVGKAIKAATTVEEVQMAVDEFQEDMEMLKQ